MSLGVPEGTEVTFSATGPDAKEAADALARLVLDNFGFND
jgi:phosphotransferase system HPr-like phosphotransfer protein